VKFTEVLIQLDINTYNQITKTLENFELYKLIEEEKDNETLSLKDAREYYKSLKQDNDL
jgi:hypothetical protein